MVIDVVGDINDEVKLQRYMNFAKFIDLLEKKGIFLCKTSLFEDKLEGGFTFGDEMLNNGDAELLGIIVNLTLPTTEKVSREEMDNNDKITEEHINRIEEEPYHTVFGDFSKEAFSHHALYEKHKDFIDVCCWHINSRESMAMWKIYGEDDCSVCVITDVGRMRRSLNVGQEYKLLIAKIEYLHYEEHYFKHKHLLSPYMHKADYYSYENEVRIIGYNPSSDINEERTDSGTFLNVNINELIQEIRVSPTAPDWFFELVISLCNKYSLRAGVTRSNVNKRISF